MDRNINLIIEDYKAQIAEAINNTQLPLGVVYYIIKDIYASLEANYDSYLIQARRAEKQAMEKAAAAAAAEQADIKPLSDEDVEIVED